MLLSKHTKPSQNIFYIATKTLETLKSEQSKIIFFSDCYEKINAEMVVSVSKFILALDFLYLINLIDKNDDGDIVKCF